MLPYNDTNCQPLSLSLIIIISVLTPKAILKYMYEQLSEKCCAPPSLLRALTSFMFHCNLHKHIPPNWTKRNTFLFFAMPLVK